MHYRVSKGVSQLNPLLPSVAICDAVPKFLFKKGSSKKNFLQVSTMKDNNIISSADAMIGEWSTMYLFLIVVENCCYKCSQL